MTVKELAGVIGTDSKKLIAQLKEAGVNVTKADDVVTDDQKALLLGFLKKTHGEVENSEPKRITLKRKQKTTLKVSGSHGKNKTVNVEVRKKRTYVKRSDLVAKEQEDRDRVEAIKTAEQAEIKAAEDKVVAEEAAAVEAAKAAEIASVEAAEQAANATEEGTTDVIDAKAEAKRASDVAESAKAAAELAEQQIEREYKILYPELTGPQIYKLIWVEDPGTETMVYTKDSQENFNGIYDERYSLLIACKTPIKDVEDTD